jgi:hypothetical protein
LQQHRLALGDLGERLFQGARLTCKNQRGKALQLGLDGFQRRLIGIVRHLPDRLAAPRIGRPFR